MGSLVVVDRPLCCSTGLCGPSPDPVLVRFAEDVAWLQSLSVPVERINPSEDPERFLAQPAVAEVFEAQGNDCLPIVLLDGEIVSTGHYPDRDEMCRLAGVGAAEMALLTPAAKELVALGASIAANCEPCFRHHYAQARKLGATRDDMAQAVAIAQAVKDAPARAMLEMADRYLSPKEAAPEAVAPKPAPGAGCCGGSTESASATGASDDPARRSSCC